MLPYKNKVTVFDGAMGSELERLHLDGLPEDYNITHPEIIQSIHKSYACADYITTNTFGLNSVKYSGKFSIKEICAAAVANARTAGKRVFFDVGPTGQMLSPIGSLTFDEAYGAYAEIAVYTRDIVDGYICETFSDLYELKACVLALKENANKPIFATMTFDASGRTLTGTTPEIAAAVLCGLGVDALGVNCSLGPKDMLSTVKRLVSVSTVPVIVQPNRGLPVIKDGVAAYTLGLGEFVKYTEKFIKAGVSVVGGCCGTTPEFINAISKFGGTPVVCKKVKHKPMVCSATKIVGLDGICICGERINPTGKPKLKEAILAGDYEYLADEAVKQANAGTDILDVNVGVPKADEPLVMRNAVNKICEYVNLPLCIDSSDPEAIENGVRYCSGIPVINSVNGDRAVLDRILPIAAKYGAVVLGLAMDENGIPKSVSGRVEIAKRIIDCAVGYGIPKHKIIIDTLTLTVSAEQEQANKTLKALAAVKRLGVTTALGVSNVSFGLPNRQLLNKTFLTAALGSGLNMPILNPLDDEMTGAVAAFKAICGLDRNCERYINAYKDRSEATAPAAASADIAEADSLYQCIVSGIKNKAAELARRELALSDPLDVVNNVIMRALDEVGKRYDSGKIFLPQLISSAAAAKVAFDNLAELIPKGGSDRGTVVLATVKGDVHDIGKNIVKAVLQSYGYSVVDLGKDTPVQTVVDAYLKHKPIAVGLSALMTTTVPNMEQTVKALREAGCNRGIFVGGAVLSHDLAAEIGADYYTKDALEFVKVLSDFF